MSDNKKPEQKRAKNIDISSVRDENNAENETRQNMGSQPVRRAVHTDIKQVRQNERSIRRLRHILAVLIVILVGLVIYITYPKWMPKLEGLFDRPVRTVFNDGDVEAGNFPLEPDNTVTGLYAVKNDLLTTDQHTLTFYDVNGKQLNSFSHNFSKPIVRTSEKRVLVFDSGGTAFKLYKKSGEVYSKDTESAILTGSLSETGTCALVTESDKYAATVLFYNKDGKLIYQYDSTSRVMSASVTEDGRSAYVCTFSSEDGDIYSKIRRLDFDKTGEQMISENIPALVTECMTNSSGDISAVGDIGMFILGTDGSIKESYEFDGELLDYSIDRSGACAAIKGNSKNSSKLVIAKAGAYGKEAFREISCTSSVKNVHIFMERVILLTSDKALAYDFTGTLAASSDIGREYSDFSFIDSALYLTGKRGIDKIKFQT